MHPAATFPCIMSGRSADGLGYRSFGIIPLFVCLVLAVLEGGPCGGSHSSEGHRIAVVFQRHRVHNQLLSSLVTMNKEWCLLGS